MAYTSVKVTADSRNYQVQMKTAAAQMKELSSEYSVAATRAKLFGKETDSLESRAETLTQKISVQKNIVQMNREEQERLTDRLDKQKNKQEELKAKIEAAKDAYSKSAKETGGNSEQTQKLKEELSKLEQEYKNNETAIGRTETALTNQLTKINQSTVKLLEMESELKNVNKELKDHKFDAFAEGCEKAGEKIESFGEKTAIVSGGILAFGTAVGKNALDTENDLMSMQGQLGLTAEETEKLKTVAQNLYINGFGEGLEECSDAIVTLMQNIKGARDMSIDQQQAIAEQMMTMSDLFDAENEELARTLTTMLNNGIIDDINEGMDILTIGFQNGANYSGELLDTMREYSPKFKELGLDANEAMAYLIQGAQNGAFNLDKVGDAMKEFSIRAVDGSDTTIDGFKRIGLNADEMANKFAAGGDTASQALHETLVSLKNMDDPIAQNTAGVELFGTMWEDLGKDVVLSLADVEGGLTGVEGATTKAGEQINSSFSTQAKTQIRELQTSLLPLGNELLRIGNDVMPTVKEVVGDVTNALKSMDSETAQNVIKIGTATAAVGTLAIGFGKTAKGISETVKTGKELADGVAGIITKITAKTAATAAGTAADVAGTAATAAGTAATTAQTAATGAQTIAQQLLNTTILGCPLVWFVGIVVAAIAAGVALYKNWDTVKEKASQLWKKVTEVWDGIKASVTEKVEAVRNAISSKLESAKNTVSNILNGIKDKFDTIFEGAKNIVKNAIDKIKGFFDFSWSLPKLKMPHFQITGGFSLTPPSVPKFSIEWYKTGAIMDKPTIFGKLGSKLLAGGEPETGGEAILPLKPFYTKLGQMLDEKIKNIRTKIIVEIPVYVNGNYTKTEIVEIAMQGISKVQKYKTKGAKVDIKKLA